MSGEVSTDAVMAELGDRVRQRLVDRLRALDATGPCADPALLEEAERILRSAIDSADSGALVLPDLLGDPDRWRLDPVMRLESHRGKLQASAVKLVKRRILLPLLRWLFEYSHDNFERQRRVNDVLFACVQDLAGETARLRREVQRLEARLTPDGLPAAADRR